MPGKESAHDTQKISARYPRKSAHDTYLENTSYHTKKTCTTKGVSGITTSEVRSIFSILSAPAGGKTQLALNCAATDPQLNLVSIAVNAAWQPL